MPLLVAGYFLFKSGFKSWRWALICLVLTTLVILDIWTGVKDYSVEATIAVNIVAVCLGGMGWLADYCIRTCHEQAERDKIEIAEERRQWAKERHEQMKRE